MTNARLQGADLDGAELQAADLKEANLQGADFTNAELQAADLQRAKLQGADLTNAGLQGADLRFARLYGVVVETGSTGPVDFETSGTALVDLRAASWTRLRKERLAEIRKVLGKTVADRNLRKKTLDHIERAGHPDLAPRTLESCLIDPEVTPALNCEQKWLPAEKEVFQRQLFPVLEKLACHSAEIAQALTWQSQEYGDARDTTAGASGSRDASRHCWTSGSARASAPCRRRTRTGSAIWRGGKTNSARNRALESL